MTVNPVRPRLVIPLQLFTMSTSPISENDQVEKPKFYVSRTFSEARTDTHPKPSTAQEGGRAPKKEKPLHA